MYRRNHAVALAMVVVINLIAVASVAAADAEGPSFWVESTHLELEGVLAGEVASATFIFHNDGPKDVNIIRAKPS